MLTFLFSKTHDVFVFPFSKHRGLSFHIQYSGFDVQILRSQAVEGNRFSLRKSGSLRCLQRSGKLEPETTTLS